MLLWLWQVNIPYLYKKKYPIRQSEKDKGRVFLSFPGICTLSLTHIRGGGGASALTQWPQHNVATAGFQGRRPWRGMGGCSPVVPLSSSRLSPSRRNSLSATCNVSQRFPPLSLLNQNLRSYASSERHLFKELKGERLQPQIPE